LQRVNIKIREFDVSGGEKSVGKFAGYKAKSKFRLLVKIHSATRHQFPIGAVQSGRRAEASSLWMRAAGKKFIMD